MNYKKKFPILGNTGEELSFIQLEHLEAQNFGIFVKKTEDVIDVNLLANAFNEVILEVKKNKTEPPCHQVIFRLIKGRHNDKLSEELPKLGFYKKYDRIEFKTPIENLPDDEGTPLLWKNAEELQWPLEKIAQVMAESAIDDPDYNPNDNALEFIKSYISDETLTSGLSCLHVGFFDSEIAAFTVVQIDPKDGWSRITYMGLLPKFRKLGLGKWLHRYGFKQIKKLGGKLYHGGTVSTNTAMIKLFLSNDCKQCHEMEEWIYECK